MDVIVLIKYTLDLLIATIIIFKKILRASTTINNGLY